MAITTEEGIRLARARAPMLDWQTTTYSLTSRHVIANFFADGVSPGSAAGAACDNTTPGAAEIKGQGAGEQLYVLRAQMIQMSGLGGGGGQESNFMLYDRLVHTSSLVATVTTTQTVNSVALPARAGSGDGVMCMGATWSGTGAVGSGAVATVSYTNSAGTAGRTGTIRTGAGGTAYDGGIMEMQGADVGVQSVQSVTFSVAGTTAGSAGIALFRPVFIGFSSFCTCDDAENMRFESSDLEHGLLAIDPAACLCWGYLNFGTNGRVIMYLETGSA